MGDEWDAASVRHEFDSAAQAGYQGRYILDVLGQKHPDPKHARSTGIVTEALLQWADVSEVDLCTAVCTAAVVVEEGNREEFFYLDNGNVRPMAVRQGQRDELSGAS